MRGAGCVQVAAEGLDESAHIVAGGAGPAEALHEQVCGFDITGAAEKVLVRARDFQRCLGGRDRQLVARRPELPALHCLRDLADDVFEDIVLRREGDLALDLDLQSDANAVELATVDDDVVKRASLARALKFDAIEHDTRQAPRLARDQ